MTRTMSQTPSPYIHESTFFRRSLTLWPTPAEFTGSSSRPALGTGAYSWPFAIPLPERCDGSDGIYALPPSYSDKAYIVYTVEVVLKRDALHRDVMCALLSWFVSHIHKLMGTPHSISQVIRYVRKSVPDPPSPLRQLSETQGIPAPGPSFDPAGWVISMHKFDGRLRANGQVVTMICHVRPSLPLLLADLQIADG